MICSQPITVTENILQNTLNYLEKPALKYVIKYPYFISEDCINSLTHINNRYNSKALDFRSYAQNILYQEAVYAQKCAPENTSAFLPYEMLITYHITYNSHGLLSLYYDEYIFRGGAHGQTKRVSDTWKVKGAEELEAEDFFPLNSNYQRRVKKEITAQIQQTEANGSGIYFSNYSQLIDEHFESRNFFIADNPNRLTVYFQEYEIAPYVMGIPLFNIPILKEV